MKKMKGNKMRRIKGRKHTFPIARSPLSKKKMIPKNEKNIPNPVKPRPISEPNEYSQYSEKVNKDILRTGMQAILNMQSHKVTVQVVK